MTPVSKIRLLLADEQRLVRQGIRVLLEIEADFDVVAEASCGQEALARAGEFRPDVILMDLASSDLDGVGATRQLKARHPEIRVLSVTMNGGDDYMFQVLEAGASGCVLKAADAKELAAAVRSVYKGGAFISPSLAKSLIERLRARAGFKEEQSDSHVLSVREKEILGLVADGRTNREMGDRLSLSVGTIQSHRSSIMKKLGLHNRSQLATYAVRVGLAPEGPKNYS